MNCIKEIESRQKEISDLQKQIGTYSKTREIYAEYNKIQSPKKRADFFEAHRADITLHQTAKNYFDGLGFSKNNPLPKIDALRKDWATLEAERQNLYHGYREAKQLRTDLVTAQSNTEWLLGINRKAPAQISGRENISHER